MTLLFLIVMRVFINTLLLSDSFRLETVRKISWRLDGEEEDVTFIAYYTYLDIIAYIITVIWL